VIALALGLMGLLALRTLVALANAFGPRGYPDHSPSGRVLVSVLIPARNEETRLPGLLADLRAQDWDQLEILVGDDGSTDGTRGVVEQAQRSDPRITILDPGPLPEGWLGKAHNCDALARQARGAVLLFLDADVRVAPSLVRRTAARFDDPGLALTSLFPRQLRSSPGEEALVPVMLWALLSLLPLRLVRRLKSPALAAANGQLLAFRAEDYHRIEPHSQVRLHPAEDIAVARLYKERGLGTEVAMAGDEISCRMYEGGAQAFEGFTRNVVHWTGGHPLFLALLALSIPLTPLAAGLAWGPVGVGAWLGLAVILQVAVARAAGEPWFRFLVWAPVRAVAFVVLAFRAIWVRTTGGTLIWKGRPLG